MYKKLKELGPGAANAVKRGAEAAANAVHEATSFVARNDGRAADGAQTLMQAVGSELDKAGQAIAAAGQQVSKALHGNASRAADRVRDTISGSGKAGTLRRGAALTSGAATKMIVHAAGLASDGVNVAGKAAATAGHLAEKSAPAVGGAVGGVVRGAAEVTSDTLDSVALSASSIEDMRAQLRLLGEAELDRTEKTLCAIKLAQARRRKDELLDLLVVGGITLAQALRDPAGVPAQIEKAFELAYPGLAQSETFSEAVNRMSSDELVGLASGVKGKLFELELLDHLNHGGLPGGFHAELAHSATQPGWDIQILDDHGHVIDFLQAKATESAQYVKDALERYPNIDVTTTTEIHGQLVAMGLAQDVHDSGISEAVLQGKLDAAMYAGAAFNASDLVPSSIGLAVIGLSVFMNKGADLREMGASFGSRSSKAGASGAVGKLAIVATQTLWLGLIAGVGSRWLASRGHGKREQYEALRTALAVMKERQRSSSEGVVGVD